MPYRASPIAFLCVCACVLALVACHRSNASVTGNAPATPPPGDPVATIGPDDGVRDTAELAGAREDDAASAPAPAAGETTVDHASAD